MVGKENMGNWYEELAKKWGCARQDDEDLDHDCVCELMMTEDGNVKQDGDAERQYNGASGWKEQCDKGEGREALKNEENNMHSSKATKNERENGTGGEGKCAMILSQESIRPRKKID